MTLKFFHKEQGWDTNTIVRIFSEMLDEVTNEKGTQKVEEDHLSRMKCLFPNAEKVRWKSNERRTYTRRIKTKRREINH